jgi:hypothetical protein
VPEGVVGGKHNNGAEGDAQGEEALSNSFIPNLPKGEEIRISPCRTYM